MSVRVRVRVRVRGGLMSNESVTECHGTSHFIHTISLGAHYSRCLHLLRATVGSKPLKRSDLTYDMRCLDHSRGVI